MSKTLVIQEFLHYKGIATKREVVNSTMFVVNFATPEPIQYLSCLQEGILYRYFIPKNGKLILEAM